MKIVENANYNKYRFVCPSCKAILEALGKEFEFLRPGQLCVTCAQCGERVQIKERKIQIIPVYNEVKKKDSKEKDL